jgi:hypothetical protein
MKTIVEMVEEFQCPGCVCGVDTKCGQYKYDVDHQTCMSHVLGTSVLGIGNFALGLPRGFCKSGVDYEFKSRNKMHIRLWTGKHPIWDNLNIAVWAMEKDGTLFVRTYSPRVNYACVDVIDGGTLSLCPGAINVAKFLDEID